MKERNAAIHRTLSARAEQEAKDITAILTELKAAIEKELNDPEYRQLEHFWCHTNKNECGIRSRILNHETRERIASKLIKTITKIYRRS